MTTPSQSKLNLLYRRLPPGRPVTSAELAELGVSRHLAVQYVRAGWLVRLARGVFRRPDGELALHPSLALLARLYAGLHLGGKTALEWHGVRHYVAQRPVIHLYGSHAAKLPTWFTTVFPATYRQKRLFRETPDALLCVSRWRSDDPDAALVADAERAWLELLSDVGVRQPLSEVRDLAAGTHTFRSKVLQQLLVRCTSVKTVRLCLLLGREVQAPWMPKLDASVLPTGSDKPWVTRTPDGLLVLPP